MFSALRRAAHSWGSQTTNALQIVPELPVGQTLNCWRIKIDITPLQVLQGCFQVPFLYLQDHIQPNIGPREVGVLPFGVEGRFV